jgi:hypothetical protein
MSGVESATITRAPAAPGGGAAAEFPLQRLIGFAFIILMTAAAVPVLMVKLPAMVDYPNHLARMYAIANLDRNPLLAQYYVLDWKLIPNLAMDVIVPALAKLTDLFTAGQIFVLLTMAAMLTGPFAVEAALFGSRPSAWPLIGFLFVYNWILLFGFVNYLLGIGLALWAVAGWIALRERHPLLRFAASLAASLVLYAVHLNAVAIYGLTILLFEVWRLRSRGFPPAGRTGFAIDLTVFAIPFVAVLALLALSPTVSNGDSFLFWSPRSKLNGILFVIKNYWTVLDLAIAAAVAAAVVWGFRRRWLEAHPLALYVLVAFGAVFLAMPIPVLGSYEADSRLPIAILFVLIGMVRMPALTVRRAALFCMAVGAVAIVRYGIVGGAWRYFDRQVADFERSFQEIRPGSKILTTQASEKDLRITYAMQLVHLPALAMAERSSFVSLAFTNPGKQILLARPEVRDITIYEGMPPRIEKVVAGEPDSSATPPAAGALDYYRDWRRRYDYVYVLYARAGRPAPSPDMSLVYQGEEFQLYRVAGH